ncbi:unnamed protein product [Pieris macdunnoughi]|uniref:Major facilitator superfamily (MFS) profile domain-containing protein n=1 Tax=Pieris macdunnoughi TaxID=345717 RepID=A0A821TMV0_9NEOP|nr:unnamed protein product [Pieris macdunnoughi]
MNKFFLFDTSKWNQILCAFIVCLPVFNYGNTLGWMSPMSLLLQSNHSPSGEPLTDVEISWLAAISYLAGVPLYFLLAYIGDRYGRKRTLLLSTALGSTIWILKLFPQFWPLFVSRCMVSILMACSFVTCPVYIKEISENSIRGHLGCWTSVFYTSGCFFTYVIGDMLGYRTIIFICLSVPILSFLLFLALPESPSYLVQIGKIEEAEKVLLWLRRKNEIDCAIRQEIETIKSEQKNDEVNDSSIIKAIFADKILFKAFQIALMAAFARELCGAIPVGNFAGDIFARASDGTRVVLNPNQQAMVMGAVQTAATIVASNIVEKSGRRPLLFITCLISGISMCSLATWFLFKDYGYNPPEWIPVFTLCICIFCDSAGLLPVGTVLIGEIFSFKYRGTVLGTSMAIASFLDFLQVLFFKMISARIGVHVAFYTFAAMCLLMALYIFAKIPETRTRPLEEIYDDLRTNKKKRPQKTDVITRF